MGTALVDAEQDKADLELMTRVSQNDEAAVAALYDRFGALVYRMAIQSMPTRGDAEEAVQEIFIRLWRTAGRYDPNRAALVTWVMLIARRHLVDRLRRARARVRASSIDQTEAFAIAAHEASLGPSEREERFTALMKRVEALPELQRMVVQRAYLGGQTLRQIGEELGTPIGTVKSALSRALVRLRERTSEELAT
ncbi:MAG: sigma-70 family RNA polymerase sigma factor [Planctomycetota bacterium]|nr:sigma-70 family RNA polymerase sigma factor [Planctomycetota bacterium]